MFAAINVLSTTVASLSFKVYRRDDSNRSEVRDHPSFELLTVTPNGETSAERWRTAMMGNVLGWGNAYAEIERRQDGKPFALHLLDPRTVTPKRADGLVYEVERRNGGTDTLRASDVLHVAGLGFDGLLGYSPLHMARRAISMGIGAESFGQSFFENAARPGGVFKQTLPLKPDAKKEFARQWREMNTGPSNTGRTAVLPHGLEWQAITIPPDEAQWIASMGWNLQQIARLYNIPPAKLQDYSRGTFSNVSEMNREYYISSVRPWAIFIEREFTWKLFTEEERRAGLYVEHNMKSLLRGDDAARGEFYKTMRELGAYNINRILELENENTIDEDWANYHWVPVNNFAPAHLAEDVIRRSNPTTKIESATGLPGPSPVEPPTTPVDATVADMGANAAPTLHDAIRGILCDCVGRLIRRETAAIRRASQKDDFMGWIDQYYPRHQQFIAEAIAPALHAANVATDSDLDPADVAEMMVMESTKELLPIADDADLVERTEGICKRWETERVEQIVEHVG